MELPPRNTAVSKELEGEWKGDYELMGYARHVTMKFTNRGAEGAGLEFIIVGKKTNNVPVSLVTQEGDFLDDQVRRIRDDLRGPVSQGVARN